MDENIISLINSTQPHNIELAFQLAKGQGIDIEKYVRITYGGIMNLLHLGGTIEEMLITLLNETQIDLEYTGNGDFTKRYLKFQKKNIESFDFNLLPNTKELRLDGTEITKLDVSRLEHLEILSIADTNIAELNLSKNINLQELRCSNTKIKNLDLSKNQELNTLSMVNANPVLETIDLTSLKSLEYLSISTTDTKIDLSKNLDLFELAILYTPIENLDLSKNPKLIDILIRDTNLKDLDISCQVELIDLDLESNYITELDLTKNPNIAFLCLDEDNLKSVDISKNRRLKKAYIFSINNKTKIIRHGKEIETNQAYDF